MSDHVSIRDERMHTRLKELAKVGALPERGVRRLAMTPEDKAGRDFVRALFEAAGLTVTVDAIGNMFGLTPGRENEPHVLTGSHVDTVATGGPYDGAYGVIGGLEAVQSIIESGAETARPLGVAVFTNEEGVRFYPDMMGSRVFTGDMPLEDALASTDAEGLRLGEALESTGYRGDVEPGSIPVQAFVELHVEQGPVLHTESLSIGAVQGVQGLYWTEYELTGATNHAGTTPMDLRRDALLGAAEAIVFARRLCEEVSGDQRATVGALRIEPSLVNVIAETAIFTTDLRNADLALLQRAQKMMDEEVRVICERHGLEHSSRDIGRVDPIVFDVDIVRLVENTARSMGLPCRRMISGAGHDAQLMAARHPAAMIFVPSRGGVSHSVHEHTDADDLTAGVRVLAQVLAELAGA